MASPDVTILDVGHGNCAIIRDRDRVVVVDGGTGTTLLQFLVGEGISFVDAVLVSHADRDHIIGVTTLLSQQDIAVGAVYVNPDSRDGDTWVEFRQALEDARQRNDTATIPHLNTNDSEELTFDDVRLEVLHPDPISVLATPQGRDIDGHQLTANRISAVLRLLFQGESQVLFGGDVDQVGLNQMAERLQPATAPVLIFPHHGGGAGADGVGFAKQICELVQPTRVVFSIGRFPANPQPSIVKGVREANPDIYIGCTELSSHCAATLPTAAGTHLLPLAAAGRARNSCCLGTVQISLNAEAGGPSRDSHSAFVGLFADALCRT